MGRVYDLSIPMDNGMLSYTTTEPALVKHSVWTIEAGKPVSLSQFNLSSHAGTHIDFPKHVLKNGKSSSDYELADLCGSGVVIEVPDSYTIITKDFIDTLAIEPNDIVFFKTANRDLIATQKFSETYVHFDVAAAEALVAKQVKIVGIDYLSVDGYSDYSLPAHKEFLGNNILIVENLDLNAILAGRYEIFICPLKIVDVDGVSARVLAI